MLYGVAQSRMPEIERIEELVDDTIGNWATENLLRDMSGFVMGMVVWFASMAYGGLHATAWSGHFAMDAAGATSLGLS